MFDHQISSYPRANKYEYPCTQFYNTTQSISNIVYFRSKVFGQKPVGKLKYYKGGLCSWSMLPVFMEKVTFWNFVCNKVRQRMVWIFS